MNCKPLENKSQTIEQGASVNHGFTDDFKDNNNTSKHPNKERKTSDDIIEK